MRHNVVTDEGADPARFVLGPAPDDVVTRKLLFEGRGVADIQGVDVVAHFRIEGIGWLILLDFDCPYEEAVCVYLLDEAFDILDVLKIDPSYTTGFIENINRGGPTEVSFTFPGPEVIHMVTIKPVSVGWLRRKTRWLHRTTRRGIG